MIEGTAKRGPGAPKGPRKPKGAVSTQVKYEMTVKGRPPQNKDERGFLREFNKQPFSQREKAIAQYESFINRRERKRGGQEKPGFVLKVSGIHACPGCLSKDVKLICTACGRVTGSGPAATEAPPPPEAPHPPAPIRDTRAKLPHPPSRCPEVEEIIEEVVDSGRYEDWQWFEPLPTNGVKNS